MPALTSSLQEKSARRICHALLAYRGTLQSEDPCVLNRLWSTVFTRAQSHRGTLSLSNTRDTFQENRIFDTLHRANTLCLFYVNQELILCTVRVRSAAHRWGGPKNSLNPPNASGLDLLAWDLVEGLTEIDHTHQNTNLLWAIGNSRFLPEIREVEPTVPLELKTDLDALLIRSETSACGADLSEVSKLSAFPGNIFMMLEALEGSGTRCLNQVNYLAESPNLGLRLASLHILGAAKDPSTEPILALLVDDKEPAVAFNAIRILETITGIHLIKGTAFADFDSNPEIRKNLTAAWKSQLRSQGVVSATLAQ